MKKYLPIFEISLAQEFAYRANFIMWRVRNVIQILIIYFLWDSVYSNPNTVLFGYDRAKMMTYVFGVLILRSIVTAARSTDVSGEISRGDLINYLLKPVNFFKYWLSRDLASKFLNLIFSLAEGLILYLVLRPEIYIPENLSIFVLFIVSVILAIILYFLLLMCFSTLTFWVVEQAWGLTFLLIVFTDLLGGIVFPIDILPVAIQKVLYALPFSYLIFMPLQIYLGKFSIAVSMQAVAISFMWIMFLTFGLRKLWSKGLQEFRAEGR